MADVWGKLNLKGQSEILVVNAPPSFEPKLKALDGVAVKRRPADVKHFDFSLAFVTKQREVDDLAKAVAQKAKGDAVVWFAYPKGSSKKYTCEFNRDTGFQPLGDAGFEPVRMVAIDDDWTAMRVRRVEFIKNLTRPESFALSKEGKKLYGAAITRERSMPATHVALLRGINVGTAKRVAMEDLRSVMTGLGFADVRTLLNSGNVVFSSSARNGDPSRQIGTAVEKRLGVRSRVTVLTAAELEVAVRGNSLVTVATHPSRLLVGVLASRDDRARLEPLARRRWRGERLALGERVCYLWCPDGVAKSRVLEEVEKMLGDGITSRNWGTIQKLHGLLQPQ